MRKLLIYFLIDTSGSMHGQPIASVRSYLDAMLSRLLRDPHALECAFLSVLACDTEVRILVEPIELLQFELPRIDAPGSRGRNLGRALEVLCARVDKEVRPATFERKGDFRLALFVVTNGRPADHAKVREMIPEVRRRFERIVVCASTSAARGSSLDALASTYVEFEAMDSESFGGLVGDVFHFAS